MADGDLKANVEIGASVNRSEMKQVGGEITKAITDSINSGKLKMKNGYIKLPVELTGFEYPKQKIRPHSGTKEGIDYSKLQNAQDELLENWKKLSKGFSASNETDIFNVLKSYRKYMKAAESQYYKNQDAENADDALQAIRRTIGKQLERYFTRLVKAPVGGGQLGSLLRAETDSSFEEYAEKAIKKFKAAMAAGVDLSKEGKLTDEQETKIRASERKLEEQARNKKREEAFKEERKTAKEKHAAEEAQLEAINKERKERSKKAITIPKTDIENVDLTEEAQQKAKEQKEAIQAKKDDRSLTDVIADEIENKDFLKNEIESRWK